MRWQVALAVSLLAAGCARKGPREDDAAGATRNQPAKKAAAIGQSPSSEPPEAETSALSNQGKTGALPAPNTAVRYLGAWARSKADCASSPWRFTRDSLDVAKGPRCSFYNVAKVPGGYDIAAQCPTKLPLHRDLIKLRFAESAQAMLVESNAILPTGLIYCSR